MSQVIKFPFGGREIRTMAMKGNAFFIARDVAITLGYSNPSDAVSRHCLYKVTAQDLEVRETRTLHPQTVLITESDVYRLAMRSNLPRAKDFERWVFDVVLPSIRKHGGYELGQERRALLENLVETQGRLVDELEATIAQSAPKVELVDRYFAASDDSMGFREVAKMLSANEHEFRLFLIKKKVTYLLGDNWTGHSSHLRLGRLEIVTGVAENGHPFRTVHFTKKGQRWIIGLWNQHKLLGGVI